MKEKGHRGPWRCKLLLLGVLVVGFTPRRAPSEVAGRDGAPSRGSGVVTRPNALLCCGLLGLVAGLMALYLTHVNFFEYLTGGEGGTC